MHPSAIRTILDTLYFTGAHRLSRPLTGGLGAILTFHRVRPRSGEAFQPNDSLEITPEFLEEAITGLRDRGFDLVSLDEAIRRIREADDDRFVVFTFDDGYRDNREHAWPILKRHEVPFVLYVTSDFADGTGRLWWLALERAIRENDRVTLPLGTDSVTLSSATAVEKQKAYGLVLDVISRTPYASGPVLDALAERYGVDPAAQCRDACMDWDAIAEFDGGDLMTVGAHTVTHPILAHLTEAEVASELTTSTDRIQAKLGTRPVHLAYPHGGPDAVGEREFAIAERLGFASAVTTRASPLFPDHAGHLAALPRISVNGLFQEMRYLDVLLSGAPTKLKYGFRLVAA